ncbi:hypothetical protein AB0M46_00080 [Dactylosporangium sp. NPDC051485]|uniref:hypothetical protein n=1 Tax=Dactylosporangium sp. NPDC051485 TaxID=3154846 RepID=UPI00343416B0
MNSMTRAYLDAVAAGRVPPDELVKALGGAGLNDTYYGNGHLPRPLFLSRAQRDGLDADLRVLHAALTSLPDRLFDGDAAAFAAAVGAQGPQIDAARAAKGQVTRLARADLYADAEGFKLLELNVTGAVGGLENARLNEAYLESPAFAQFAAEHNLGHVDTLVALAETLGDETGTAGRQPLVGIVDWPDSYPHLEVQLRRNAELLGERGVEAIVGHVGMLQYRDGGVWLHGRRLDVVYRLFLVESLLRPGGAGLLAPVLAAAARSEVAMFTPIASELYGSKTALVLLSDERHRDRFCAAELDVIDRVLPWTRRLQAGPVTVDGERADLLDYALRDRERLVVKATMLHGGHGFVAGWLVGPDEWERELRRAEGGPFVLQRRVVPEPELMPDPYTATWGVFLTGRGYAGTFVRAVAGRDAGVVAYTGGALAGCVFHER